MALTIAGGLFVGTKRRFKYTYLRPTRAARSLHSVAQAG